MGSFIYYCECCKDGFAYEGRYFRWHLADHKLDLTQYALQYLHWNNHCWTCGKELKPLFKPNQLKKLPQFCSNSCQVNYLAETNKVDENFKQEARERMSEFWHKPENQAEQSERKNKWWEEHPEKRQEYSERNTQRMLQNWQDKDYRNKQAERMRYFWEEGQFSHPDVIIAHYKKKGLENRNYCVYFIESDKFVKVGFTANLEERLKSFYGFKVTKFYDFCLEDAVWAEYDFHSKHWNQHCTDGSPSSHECYPIELRDELLKSFNEICS